MVRMQSRSLMTLLATTAALWGVPAHGAREAASPRTDLRRSAAVRIVRVVPSIAPAWPRRSPVDIGRAFVRPR